ncbi:MAG: hypothetical protein QXG03_03215 [Halalkalicoccus sp.]
MVMQTYTLQVVESETDDGLDVDVYGEDGTIEASTWIGYDDYRVAQSGEAPDPLETGFTADVLALDVQVERDGEAFAVRVLGNGEELTSERLVDGEWGLADE